MYKKFREILFFMLKFPSGKIGAISASSSYVVRRVMGLVDSPLRNVVEYGAGTGVMTKALLQRLPPDGKLIAVEADPQFAKILRQIGDDRLQIIEGSIQDQILDETHGFSDIDLVVSSIPFSFLTTSQREKVIADTEKILSPEGSFILFHQYKKSALEPLRNNFKKISILFEPRNIFPSFILHAEKIKK